jgi:UDP-N-acetylglucosamine 2-epimerase (non-hydrolysing)
VVDAMKRISQNFGQLNIPKEFRKLSTHKRLIILTIHRRENLGPNLVSICKAVKYIARKYKEVHFLFPVHPNPKVKVKVSELLKNISNVEITAPLPYSLFIYLLSRCYAVLTDSCGIQEEAPNLCKPLLLLRELSEREESIFSKNTKLVGSKTDDVIRELEDLLTNEKSYYEMTAPFDLYGDGKASEKICALLEEIYTEESVIIE